MGRGRPVRGGASADQCAGQGGSGRMLPAMGRSTHSFLTCCPAPATQLSPTRQHGHETAVWHIWTACPTVSSLHYLATPRMTCGNHAHRAGPGLEALTTPLAAGDNPQCKLQGPPQTASLGGDWRAVMPQDPGLGPFTQEKQWQNPFLGPHRLLKPFSNMLLITLLVLCFKMLLCPRGPSTSPSLRLP